MSVCASERRAPWLAESCWTLRISGLMAQAWPLHSIESCFWVPPLVSDSFNSTDSVL